ncbi:YfcZ/YiiS family protein [Escherichia coli]
MLLYGCGTIMDNSDCTASYSRVFANRAEAEQTLAALTEKARSVESEPCKISPTFTEESDGVRLISISLLPAKLKC